LPIILDPTIYLNVGGESIVEVGQLGLKNFDEIEQYLTMDTFSCWRDHLLEVELGEIFETLALEKKKVFVRQMIVSSNEQPVFGVMTRLNSQVLSGGPSRSF
jgi:hypothetical protein